MKTEGDGFSVELFAGFCFQAFGNVAGRDFFFKACRFDWKFEIANDSGLLPADGGLTPEEAVGTEFQSHWFRVGKLHKWSEELTDDEAFTIIQRAVREYLGTG